MADLMRMGTRTDHGQVSHPRRYEVDNPNLRCHVMNVRNDLVGLYPSCVRDGLVPLFHLCGGQQYFLSLSI